MRLLLIEDERRLSEALECILKESNYGIDVAYDGISGQELAETGIYDLIILDRMLPGKEGVSILKELRAQGLKTPVLLLTAKDSIEDRVEGLDAGADDYLVKPFASEELLARIRVLSRRREEKNFNEKIKVGSLILDPLHCQADFRGKKLKLTLKESQLLELLMVNKGQVLTKEQILYRIWGLDSEVEITNIETYIYFLRKKLDAFQCNVCIETVRGVGYCLQEGKYVP